MIRSLRIALACVVILVAGIVALWVFASSSWVDKRLSRLIDGLLKRYTELNVKDYASLLHLTGEYRLAELKVENLDWLDSQTLESAQLREEGINVLGVQRRDGAYVGNPVGQTKVYPGDNLILYGRISAIQELDRRKKGYRGDQEHQEAIQEQQEVVEKETEEFKG